MKHIHETLLVVKCDPEKLQGVGWLAVNGKRMGRDEIRKRWGSLVRYLPCGNFNGILVVPFMGALMGEFETGLAYFAVAATAMKTSSRLEEAKHDKGHARKG